MAQSILAHEVGHALGLPHTVEGNVLHLVMASVTGPTTLFHHYGSDTKRLHFEESKAANWNESPSPNEAKRILWNAKTLPWCSKVP